MTPADIRAAIDLLTGDVTDIANQLGYATRGSVYRLADGAPIKPETAAALTCLLEQRRDAIEALLNAIKSEPTGITLSHRQRKEADRVGGIELIVPYPAGTTPHELDEDEECDASPDEAAAAHQAVGGDLGDELVPVRVRVVRLRQQGDAPVDQRPVRHYLSVTIIGRRWVHARTKRAPKVMWSQAALDGRVIHGTRAR